MATNDSAGANPVATVPGNWQGSFAGAVGAVVVGALSNAGYIGIVAKFIAVPAMVISGVVMTPEMIVGGIVMMAVTGAVSYGVSHVSGIKTVNDLYNMIPSTYAEYPGDSPKPAGTTNLVDSAGNPVKAEP